MYSNLRRFVQQRRRLISVTVYGVINALPQLTNALLAILYTSVFSLPEYGAFGILAVILTLVVICFDLGIPWAVLRNYYDRNADWHAARTYIADINFSANLFSLAILPVLGLVLYLTWSSFYIGQTNLLAYIALILCAAFFERSLEMLDAIFRILDKPLFYAAGRIAQALAALLGGVLFVFVLHMGVLGALIAIVIARIAGASTYEILLRFGLGVQRGRFRWKELKACLSFGLPLVPNRLASWARTAALRPVLVNVVPLSGIGLFSLASAISSLPLLVSSSVDLALSPHYFKQRAANSEGFTHRIENFGTISAAALTPLWTAAILFCPELIRIFAGQRYAGATPICAILLCASFVRAQQPFLLRQIHFLKQTWILPAITIPCAMLSVFLALILSYAFGIGAVGWAALAADASLYAALAILIQVYERVHHPMFTTLGLTGVLAIAASWIAWQPTAPTTLPVIVLKGAVVFVVSAACFAIWIWPNRVFIRAIARG